ncbi:LacI family DNA-binding transcriptional regulator [Microbacterium sp.]|uniref:LacI family DNA-binding transcriptional regulator n=1 Tax=Microbacterium sp. TaxID=51671 RepID=UPI0039E59AB4
MVTITDVARAAGVSTSTVSYVLSGKRTISQQTKERVEQAISELKYSPHASARSLASRSTNVIGLHAPLRSGVDVHIIMEIVAGMVREARAHHYDILLLTSDDASELSRVSRASMVDALLVMDVESDDPRIALLKDLATPALLIGLPAGADGVPCVDFDFETAGRLAASRLVELGHRRIALLGAPAEVMTRQTSYSDRLGRGFLTEAQEAGVAASVHACPSTEDAVEVVDRLLSENPEITGILFHNEGALPHVAGRLSTEESGRVLDVIALRPAGMAHTVSPLTDSIDLPAEELGAAAARAILRFVDGEEQPPVQLLAPHLESAQALDDISRGVTRRQP